MLRRHRRQQASPLARPPATGARRHCGTPPPLSRQPANFWGHPPAVRIQHLPKSWRLCIYVGKSAQRQVEEAASESTLGGTRRQRRPPGQESVTRGHSDLLRDPPATGLGQEAQELGCFSTPSPTDLHGEDLKPTLARAGEFGVRNLFTPSGCPQVDPWHAIRSRLRAAICPHRADQRGVHGHLRTMPQREAVGHDFEPTVVLVVCHDI